MKNRNFTPYKRMDACRAVTSSKSANGLFLHLDNEEVAVCFKQANIPTNVQVLCSVECESDFEHGKRAKVVIESVNWDDF